MEKTALTNSGISAGGIDPSGWIASAAAPVVPQATSAMDLTAPAYAVDRLIVKLKPTGAKDHFDADMSMAVRSAVFQADALQALGMDLDVASIQAIGQTGVQVWHLSGDLSVEEAVAKYNASGLFEFVQPDYVIQLDPIETKPENRVDSVTPNDPGFPQLWGMHNTGQTGGTADADIDAPEAWQIQTGNHNLVIGVIDTGVDYTHPDLAANIWTNPGEIAGDGIDNDHNGYIDDIHGWDFVNNDNNPMDDNGHGTHVSGTIAGDGNNSTGVAGVAWNAQLMGLKFLDASGNGHTSGAIAAINYANTMGVKLTNNSWHGGGDNQALSDAIATAAQQGALFVAAAGNDGRNTDLHPNYPSNYDYSNIISVAATDNRDALAYFSNYGSSSVDLAAPGVAIYSTWMGGGYNTISGTSMATPHVTGAVALLWSQHPDWTAQQIKNVLLQSVDPVSGLNEMTVTGGRLNINNALHVSTPPHNQPITTNLSAAEAYNSATTVLDLTNIVVSDADSPVLTVTLTISNPVAGSLSTATYGGVTSTYDPATGVWSASGATADLNVLLADLTYAPSPGFTGNFTIASRVSDGDTPAVTGLKNVYFDVSGGTDTSATLAVGGTASGGINPTGDHDWYRIELVAGTFYQFDQIKANGSGLDPYLRLRDANGVQIAYDDDSGDNYNSRIIHIATQTGTYYLDAGGYDDYSMGGYTVSASTQDSQPVATNLSATETYNNVTVALNLVDIVVADADSPSLSVTLTLSNPLAGSLNIATSGSVTSTYDPATGIWSASGATADLNVLLADLTYTPSPGFTGSFTIATRVSDGALAVSGLKNVYFDISGDADTTATLVVGATARESINPVGDHDWYRIELVAGTSYTFEQGKAPGSTLDAYLRLRDSNGVQIAYDDDGGVGYNSRIVYTATQSGVYYLDAAGYGDHSVGTFTLTATIPNVNYAPVLTGGQATLVNGGEDIAYSVSANDLLTGYTDVNGDPLSVADLSANHGSVTNNGNGTYTITPVTNYNGTVSLSYSITDGRGGVVAASQSFVLNAVNDAPVLTGSPATLPVGMADVPYTASAASLLQGFSDIEGDSLSVANLSADHGSVVDNGNSTYTITPSTGYLGIMQLSYGVSDGADSTAALLGYTITDAANTAPTFTNSLDASPTYIEGVAAVVLDNTVLVYDAELSASGNYGGASITLARHDSPDTQDVFSASGNLIFSSGNAVLSGITVGTVSNDNGVLTIVFNSEATQARVNETLSSIAYANASSTPPDSVRIDWTFSDGNVDGQGAGGALDAVGGTTVNITAVNHVPALTGALPVLPAAKVNMPYTVSAAGLLVGYTDIDGESLSVANLSANHGSVADNGNGTFTITPVAGYRGVMQLGYDVSDGIDSIAATLGYTVSSAVNTAPTFFYGMNAVTTDFGGYDKGHGIVLQTDGRILVAGSSSDDMVTLARYNINGTLDSAFDGDGRIATNFSSYQERWDSLAMQSDGKILAAGYSGHGFALARYNPDGGMDATLDGDGLVITDLGGYSSMGHDMAVQSDGRILVVGEIYLGGGYTDFAMARYNTDGSLDSTFSEDGKLTSGNGLGSAESVVVQEDGKILVTGYASAGQFVVARYNAEGSLDTSFDGDGKLATAFSVSSGSHSLSVQSDSKIIVAGYTQDGAGHNNFALARYNSDGSLDTSFDGDGKLTTHFGNNSAGLRVTMQSDGKILVAGYSDYDFALARYNSNGRLDTSFSGDGKLILDFFKGDDSANGIRVQSDGRILLAGYSTKLDGDSDFAMVRLNGDGSLDTTFGSANNSLDATPAYTENAAAVVFDKAVRVYDAELSASGGYNGANITLVRHGGANAEDVFSARGELSFFGSVALLSGVNIGSVSNGGGMLSVTFNANATQARVNKALSSIAYSNSSDAPPSSVQVDWTFNDGNAGRQGAGGALATAGGITVSITARNDAPTGSVRIDGTLLEGQTLAASHNLADKDGLGAFGYQWRADGIDIEGATNSTYILTASEVGKTITVTLAYTDGGGTGQVVSSPGTRPVSSPGVITGSAGHDTLNGTAGADHLQGLDGNDSLAGGYGIDFLDGGAGADTMRGGTGNDTYIVDDSGDRISEKASEGSDLVQSSVSHTLGANLENLVLTGSANVNASGNGGNNLLTGNNGDNALNGGAGNDTLGGGGGNDTYTVDNAKDIVNEELGQGNDTVRAGVSYSLAANVENLILTGAGNTKATGNDVDNTLVGNDGSNNLAGNGGNDILIGGKGGDAMAGGTGNDSLEGGLGNDTLNGGLGNDTLAGGSGKDVFMFKSILDQDIITDFNAKDDAIWLDNAVMAGLGSGTGGLRAATFNSGAGMTSAVDASDRIVYDTGTGNLYYDMDGSGAEAAIQFATLTGHPTLTSADFIVV